MQTSISKTNYLFDSIFEPTRNSSSTFLINDDKKINYADFHIMINQLANVLIQKGMKPGDRVAVQAEKSNTQIALYAATIKAGGVYLPLNTGYTTSELDYFIKDSSAKIIIVDKNVENKIVNNLDANTVLLTLNSDETGSLTNLADEQDFFLILLKEDQMI
jgi:malonyl-CoA/methylmalonyl-CoA synthetase